MVRSQSRRLLLLLLLLSSSGRLYEQGRNLDGQPVIATVVVFQQQQQWGCWLIPAVVIGRQQLVWTR